MNDKYSKSQYLHIKNVSLKFNGHGAFCCLDVTVNVLNVVRDSLILEPLRHSRADLNNEKDVFALIHEMVFA